MPKGIIVFNAGGRELCFDINHLLKILDTEDVDVRRMKANRQVTEVLFNEESFPLIDVVSLISGRKPAVEGARRVLLVEYGNFRDALLVEAVTDIISGVAASNWQSRFVPREDEQFFLGYYEIDSRKLWQVDLSSLLASADNRSGARV